MAAIRYVSGVSGESVKSDLALNPVPVRIAVNRAEVEDRRHDGVEIVEIDVHDGSKAARTNISVNIINGHMTLIVTTPMGNGKHGIRTLRCKWR